MLIASYMYNPLLQLLSSLLLQSNYSNVVVREGAEPENFFWVALGGRAPYESVSQHLLE